MHDAVLTYVAANIPTGCLVRVLEFGSRNINGSVRRLFPHATEYVGIDTIDGPDVDVVADASTYDVGRTFDVVVCAEVLEHVTDDIAAGLCANAYKHLHDGGVFVATMAGPGRMPHSAIDGNQLHPGEFYRNVDQHTLAGWLTAAGFTTFDIDQLGRDMRCTATR